MQEINTDASSIVGLLCRNPVETEAAGFLALAEEVPEEVVQHVSVPVELQETLRVLRFRGGAFRCTVCVQPGWQNAPTAIINNPIMISIAYKLSQPDNGQDKLFPSSGCKINFS